MGGGRLCLGIDPGLARVGYGVVERQGSRLRALTYGCVETSPKLPFTQRLLHIYEALGEQLEHCAPDFMSVKRHISRCSAVGGITRVKYPVVRIYYAVFDRKSFARKPYDAFD